MIKETVLRTLKKIKNVKTVKADIYNTKGIYITEIKLEKGEFSFTDNFYKYLLLKKCQSIEVLGTSYNLVNLKLTIKGLPFKRELIKHIQKLEAKISQTYELEEELRSIKSKFANVEQENIILKEKVDDLTNDIKLLKSSIEEKDNKIELLEEQLRNSINKDVDNLYEKNKEKEEWTKIKIL